MLNRKPFCLLILLAIATAVVKMPGVSQAEADGTDTYAITNARIVPVAGPAIERGTIVIRDGLIAAVGANVSAPAGARITTAPDLPSTPA